MVTIEFDDALDDHATTAKDRTNYPRGADVHITISDNFLNVDPTDEDSWTFGTNSTNSTTVYQVYDENGQNTLGANSISGTPNLQAGGNLTTINAGDLAVLLINGNPNNAAVVSIIDLFDNNDQNITESLAGPARVVANGAGDVTKNLGQNSAPVTVVETEATSGLFQNTDESDVANIRVATDAPRGTTATIDYNDSPTSVLVSNFFGTINMDESALGGEWNSGEEIGVLLTDQDTNLNSKVDEDIKLSDPRFTIIPSLRIGTPRTLTGSIVNFSNTLSGTTGGVYFNSTTVDAFSDVSRATVLVQGAIPGGFGYINYTYPTAPGEWDPGTTNSKYVYLNYDIRSFQNSFGNVPFEIRATNTTVATTGALFGSVVIATGQTNYQQLIDVTPFVGAVGGTDALAITFNFTLPVTARLNATTYPSVVDVFSFFTSGDGNLATERFNNAIYRFELEETGDNTSQFEGTVEYIMLNQINVNQTLTYTSGVDPISDEARIVVCEDLTH